MFSLDDPNLTRITHAESPIPDSPEPTTQAAADPLDAPEAIETFHRLLDCYTRELDRQEENRQEQAEEEDCYDGIQWDPDDAIALKDRGQMPLVYNVTATTVNWILGTEKRTRSDFHVLPRRKEDGKPAERKSQILKYLSDCNRTPFHRSRAFADSVKVGLGWLEDFVEIDGEGEPIKSRYESWRNMLWDSAGTELDIEDARYVFRSKWVDCDIAKALFLSRSGVIDMAARNSDPIMLRDDFGDDAMDIAEREMDRSNASTRLPERYVRERVRLIEAWFKVPEPTERLSGGMFHGELFDGSSPAHVDQVNDGSATIIKKMALRTYCALFTTAGLLWLGPSPYRHNRYPFTPIWGNRRGRDGLPYGIIRPLKDVNFDLNKRASKALQLFTTKRIIAEDGAAEDMDALFDELERPDARATVKNGKLAAVRVETDHELANGHIELMQHDIGMIQQVGGVTDENLGRKSNATSGIAIERRQTQGTLTTAHYFDNLRFASQVQGEKELALTEQWMTDEKQFRITNMRGKPEYITVNDGLPQNDIVRSKADFVITEADWRATVRQASADQLMELLLKLAPVNPQLVMVMLDLAIESTDIPNREEIVRRVRELTGMQDPDAEETPEQAQQRQAAKDKQAALQQATAEAALRKVVSEALRNEGAAQQAEATAVRQILTAIGGPKRGAIDVASDLMTQPAIAPVADEVLHDAGYVTRTEKEAGPLPQPAAQPQPPQQTSVAATPTTEGPM